MKKIMKKNQVIITSLAILIAVAGYLNFADVNLGSKDKEASTDSSSILEDVDYDISEETALLEENGEEIGEPLAQDTGTPGEKRQHFLRKTEKKSASPWRRTPVHRARRYLPALPVLRHRQN